MPRIGNITWEKGITYSTRLLEVFKKDLRKWEKQLKEYHGEPYLKKVIQNQKKLVKAYEKVIKTFCAMLYAHGEKE